MTGENMDDVECDTKAFSLEVLEMAQDALWRDSVLMPIDIFNCAVQHGVMKIFEQTPHPDAPTRLQRSQIEMFRNILAEQDGVTVVRPDGTPLWKEKK